MHGFYQQRLHPVLTMKSRERLLHASPRGAHTCSVLSVFSVTRPTLQVKSFPRALSRQRKGILLTPTPSCLPISSKQGGRQPRNIVKDNAQRLSHRKSEILCYDYRLLPLRHTLLPYQQPSEWQLKEQQASDSIWAAVLREAQRQRDVGGSSNFWHQGYSKYHTNGQNNHKAHTKELSSVLITWYIMPGFQ